MQASSPCQVVPAAHINISVVCCHCDSSDALQVSLIQILLIKMSLLCSSCQWNGCLNLAQSWMLPTLLSRKSSSWLIQRLPCWKVRYSLLMLLTTMANVCSRTLHGQAKKLTVQVHPHMEWPTGKSDVKSGIYEQTAIAVQWPVPLRYLDMMPELFSFMGVKASMFWHLSCLSFQPFVSF